jgi:hypothetical protein
LIASFSISISCTHSQKNENLSAAVLVTELRHAVDYVVELGAAAVVVAVTAAAGAVLPKDLCVIVIHGLRVVQSLLLHALDADCGVHAGLAHAEEDLHGCDVF